MEPTIPTSFIPKRPMMSAAPASAPTHRRSVGVLSLLTAIIVLGTLASFAGVYLYEQQLISQKQSLEAAIAEARDGIGTDFITDMRRLDARIDGVQELIKNHIVVTPIFKELEAKTLRSVQYKDFSYSYTPEDKSKLQEVTVELTGTAKSYATIALQSDAFSDSTLIKNPVFSNLTLDEKTRAINFRLVFTVDPLGLSYQSFIDSMNKQQTITPTTALPTSPADMINQPTP